MIRRQCTRPSTQEQEDRRAATVVAAEVGLMSYWSHTTSAFAGAVWFVHWVLLLMLVVSAPAMAQSKPRQSKSKCPAPRYQTACDSYQELLKAGDEDLSSARLKGNIGLVCFRPNVDSFFVIVLDGPPPATVPTLFGVGGITEFVNGIAGNHTMPISIVSGAWTKVAGNFFFVADRVNVTIADAQNAFAVSSDQVHAQARYKNASGQDVDYQLVIQRSTGRFTEQVPNAWCRRRHRLRRTTDAVSCRQVPGVSPGILHPEGLTRPPPP